jgi:hypothetical protein
MFGAEIVIKALETMTDLDVALLGVHIRHPAGTGDAFDFAATPDAVRHFGLGSRVLSRAVPLVACEKQ